MKTTTFGGILQHLGGVPVMAGVPYSKDATYYFVDAATGADGNDGLTPESALATIIAAEDKCVANRHDTVFYIASGSSINITRPQSAVPARLARAWKKRNRGRNEGLAPTASTYVA